MSESQSEYTDDQKRSILFSLIAIGGADGRFGGAENQYIEQISSLLGYHLVRNDEAILGMNRSQAYQNLRSLTASQKEWFVITAIGMVNINDVPSRKKETVAKEIINGIGIATDEIHRIMNKAMRIMEGFEGMRSSTVPPIVEPPVLPPPPNSGKPNTNSIFNWKALLIIIGVIIAGIFIWKYTSNYFTKEKLINGNWYLTSLTTINGETKQYVPNPQPNPNSIPDQDLFFVEMNGNLWVNFKQGNLSYPCEIKGNEVWLASGQYKLFIIQELTDSHLIMEQTLVNNIYIDLGMHGRRVEFVNLPATSSPANSTSTTLPNTNGSVQSDTNSARSDTANQIPPPPNDNPQDLCVYTPPMLIDTDNIANDKDSIWYGKPTFLYGVITEVAKDYSSIKVRVVKTSTEFAKDFRSIDGESWYVNIDNSNQASKSMMNEACSLNFPAFFVPGRRLKFAMVEGYPDCGTSQNGVWHLIYAKALKGSLF